MDLCDKNVNTMENPTLVQNVSQQSSTDKLLMMSLSRFYHDDVNMKAVLPYMNNTASISLRMIDWFVTNYSKKYAVVISQTATFAETVVDFFNVYVNYRAQLKAYSKQQFDPFRRRDRILLQYDEGTKHVQTTVGQLNFFRWLLQNKILDYITLNASTIELDMMHSDRSTYQRANRRTRSNIALHVGAGSKLDDYAFDVRPPLSLSLQDTGTVEMKPLTSQKRRTELSKANIPTMNRHPGTCTVMFS